jgi:hypothetical protein
MNTKIAITFMIILLLMTVEMLRVSGKTEIVIPALSREMPIPAAKSLIHGVDYIG